MHGEEDIVMLKMTMDANTRKQDSNLRGPSDII